VVRHGQSTWNVEHRFTGQADPPLSALGLRQAVALAESCRALDLDAVVSSDLRRAHATAAVVADEVGLPAPVVLPDLRERWSEGLTGRTRDEIETSHPDTLSAWRRGAPVGAPGPHEPFDVFVERVLRGLVAATAHGDRVLVVAHAGIFVVLDTMFGEAGTQVANAEGRVVRVDEHRVVGVAGDLVLPALAGTDRSGRLDP